MTRQVATLVSGNARYKNYWTHLHDFSLKYVSLKDLNPGVGQESLLSGVFFPSFRPSGRRGNNREKKGDTTYELIQINNDNSSQTYFNELRVLAAWFPSRLARNCVLRAFTTSASTNLPWFL